MPAHVICPACQQSDQVAKVSTLYMEGIGLRKISEQKDGEKDLLRYSNIPDKELAKLVKKLSPPSSGKTQTVRPVHPDWIIAAFSAVLPVFLFGIYRSQPAGLFPILLILVLLYGLYFLRRKALIARYHQGEIIRQEETRRIEIAIQRWMRLYYCSRDRGVFVPEKNLLIPVDQMIPYLIEEREFSSNR